MVKRVAISVFTLIICCSCNTIDFSGFFYSPSGGVEKRFKESMSWNSEHPAVVLPIQGDKYGFMVCSDVHIHNSTTNWSYFLDCLRNDSTYSFGIVVGDLTDGRGTMRLFYEALQFDASRQKYNDTVFVTSGNHDLFFNDWELYREYFGTSVYSFVVKSDGGEDLFISLDSSNGTLGKSQKEWFKRLLEDERSKYRHCVVYTHTNLYNTEGSQVGSGNYPIEETAWISNQLSKHKVDLMIMGHDHWGELYSFGGVNYIVLDALKDGFEKAGYLEIEIGEDISLNFVSIKKRE